jgi:AraC family transcriptional regulator
MDIQIETIEATPVACVRHIGPYPEMSGAWEALMGYAAAAGIVGTDAMFLGLYYDDPAQTPGPELRSDACVTVSADAVVEAPVELREIAAGRYITAVHVGPFDTLSETYGAMAQWGTGQDVTFREHPTIEMYLTDPETTPPEEFETKLFMAIE